MIRDKAQATGELTKRLDFKGESAEVIDFIRVKFEM